MKDLQIIDSQHSGKEEHTQMKNALQEAPGGAPPYRRAPPALKEEYPEPRHSNPVTSALKQFAIMIALAVIVFVVLQNTVHSSIVLGSSMEPSLHNDQRLLMVQVAYNFGDPQRGDVIIFRPPYNPDSLPLIKRVIGLPGETVEIKQGKVYIYKDDNVVKLDEPYIKSPPGYNYSTEVPPGEFFVLGDNRNSSNDSHTGWTVPRSFIIGKAWLSIWPPSDWGTIDTHNLPQ